MRNLVLRRANDEEKNESSRTKRKEKKKGDRKEETARKTPVSIIHILATYSLFRNRLYWCEFSGGKYDHEVEGGRCRMRSWEREGERVRGRRGRRRRGVLVSILSEPRISEFEFVPLSADSIVIAYLRGGWGQAISTYFMRRDPRRGRHACIHVFSRVSVTRNLPSLDVYRR